MSNNEIRLTPGEIAFAVRVLSKNLNNIAYEPEAVIERVVREVNEQRKRTTAKPACTYEITAGPFGSAAEQIAAQEAYRQVQAERVRDGELRVQALSLAIKSGTSYDSPDARVEDAEKFYSFLKGKS